MKIFKLPAEFQIETTFVICTRTRNTLNKIGVAFQFYSKKSSLNRLFPKEKMSLITNFTGYRKHLITYLEFWFLKTESVSQVDVVF